MATRDEIEAAVERFEGSGGFACSFIEECEDDLFILAQAYITERAERQRRIEAAAEELATTLPLYIRCGAAALCVDIITRCLDGETS